MNEKETINKKHLFVYIFLFISIIFVTLSTTYAWYDEETASYNEATETVAAASNEGIELTGTSVVVSDLVPASEEDVKTASFTLDDTQCKNTDGDSICFLYEFTVTNNDVNYRNVLYYLTPTENTFTNLKFKVYNSSKAELSETSKINMLATSLARNDLNTIELTGMTRKITENASMTYTIVFWIEKQDADQTIADAAKTFKADLSVDLIATGYGYMDVDAPVVSNVSLSEDSRTYGDGNLGNYTVSWEAADEHGSDISKYVIGIYNSSGELQFTDEIIDSTTYSKTYNGLTGDYPLTAGDYYATVYAIDSNNNSGEMFCLEDTSNYCGKSATSNIKYKLLYTTSTSYSTFSMTTAADSIVYGGTATFTVNKGSASGYTYTFGSWSAAYSTGTSIDSGTTSGTKTISNLTGDFKVTVTSTRSKNSCLAEGTKILLADGTYKNVEDIKYDDLMVVMDYQNGGITYQYPLWLEKEKISPDYINIKFSDGSEIDIVGDHGFFSYDHNEFVVVSDTEKFHVGTKVAKLNKGKLEEVIVESIETIEEEMKYYLIMSTRYYNVIANDIVTTDDAIFVTNLYGFNKDITWRDPVATDLYTRDELSILPNFLYEGLRAEEGKYLNKFGVDYDTFINFLINTQLNEEIWDKPKLNKNGKREWMVTTSEDKVNQDNKKDFLMEEGNYYTLKEPKNIKGKKFIGWLHTGENIMYQPGDKVEVLYGTHFVAKYQDLFDNGISELN